MPKGNPSGYVELNLEDEEKKDPLFELSQLMGGSSAQRPGQAAAPVNEQALQDGARTFYDPNFVNAGRYAEANKGQGAAMAHGLAGDVAKKGNDAKSAISTAAAKFKQGTTGGGSFTTGAPSTGAVQSRGGGSSPYAYAAGGGIGGATSGQGAYQSYSGAESLGEASPELAGQIKDADAAADKLGTDEGVAMSLKDKYGGAHSSYYGSSGNGLDAFLTNSEGHGELAQTQKEFGGLEDVFADANAASQGQVAERRGQDKAHVAALAATRPGATAKAAAPVKPEKWAPDPERYKQRQADSETSQWLGNVLREKTGGFLGIGSSALIDLLPPNYAELPADKMAELTKAGGAFMEAATRAYGADKAREIANAMMDYRGRSERTKKYAEDMKLSEEANRQAWITYNHADPNYQATYKPEEHWFDQQVWNPLEQYLMDEQKKRNAGKWSPDVNLV